MNWWVVQTQPQREHLVRLLLMKHCLVTYAPRIKHHGRIGFLFPTYVLVGACERFYPILSTQGVVRLLMSGDQPAKLSEDVVIQIRKREHNGFVKLPSPPRLKKGQQVRVVRGLFQGQVALYEGMGSKDRERVLLNLLGQSVPVELPGRDLEPLTGCSVLKPATMSQKP